MKQIFLLILLLVGMMFTVYWLSIPENANKLFNGGLANFTSEKKSEEKKTENKNILKIGKNEIIVEIADTENKRRVGLSSHASLTENSSMLFIFEKQDERPVFWMKGMDFPIDILWINDGKVSQITANVPTPKEALQDSDLPRYLANNPIDYVVELPAGNAKKLGIRVGDTISLPQNR